MNHKKHIVSFVVPVCSCALLAWLAIQFPTPPANAVGYPTPTPNCAITPMPSSSPMVPLPTCTCSPTPYGPGGEVLIPTDFQPPPPYTAKLGWVVFTPTPAPAASPPGIVVIHGGGWHAGNTWQAQNVCQDLAAAGYYVVSVAYELARCGSIQEQNCHDEDDSLPDDMVTRQTNDIKAFINALRADPNVDSTKIGVLGGSAGATHAVWVALDTTDSGNNGTVWPYWKADKRPQCAVMLSAAYDFSDRTPPPGMHGSDSMFIFWTENYVNSADLATLKAKSPISLVKTPTEANPVPLFMINSWFDMPPSYHQIVGMMCALQAKDWPESAYQTLTVPDTDDHSFALWPNWDRISNPHKTVGQDVIEFLDAHLK